MTDELGFAAAEAMGLVEVGPAPKKSPEQRVREAWERVSWGAIGTPADDYEGVRITCESRTKIFDSWQAAREFTEQRLEEIRCLEREIWIVGEMLQVFSHAAEQAIKAPPGYCHADLVRN